MLFFCGHMEIEYIDILIQIKLMYTHVNTHTMSNNLINLVLKNPPGLLMGRGLLYRASLWLAGCSGVVYDDKFLTGVTLSPAGEDWWDTRERSIISGRWRRIGIWEICSQSHLQAGGHPPPPHPLYAFLPSSVCQNRKSMRATQGQYTVRQLLQALMDTSHSKRVDTRGNWQLLRLSC